MVRFGYGYDQTPLQIFSSGRKSQRISLRAADKLRAAPYTIPFKPRADTATVRSRLEEQKREGNRNISNREKVGGGIRKKPRFYDIDYSYERIELRDRMLDILPTPPPYGDTLFNYNIDTNPSAPPPETSDYGHKDTTATPDEDDPKQDPDEDDPKQDPVPGDPIPLPDGDETNQDEDDGEDDDESHLDVTPAQQYNIDKGQWESIYMNPSSGKYVLPSDVLLSTQDPTGQVLSDSSWKWLSDYASYMNNTALSDTLKKYGRDSKIFVTRNVDGLLGVQVFKSDSNSWTDPYYIHYDDPTEEMLQTNSSLYSQVESVDDWTKRWYNSKDNFWYIPKTLSNQRGAAYNKQVPLTIDESLLGYLKNFFLEYNRDDLSKPIAERMNMNTPFTLEFNTQYSIVRWNDPIYGPQTSYIRS